MQTIYFILGKTGSGKSTIYNKIISDKEFVNENDIKPLIYCTTRKKRENEIEGVDYYFTTMNDYLIDFRDKKVIESREYTKIDEGIVRYYTTIDNIESQKCNALICAGSVDQYFSYRKQGYRVIPIVIGISNYNRITRILNREKNISDNKIKEICRRFLEEDNEFNKFYEDQPTLSLFFDNNEDGNIDINLIKTFIKSTINIG